MNLNKKAQGSNYLAVIIFLFIFGVFNILAYTVWLEFVKAITTAGYNVGAVAVTIANFTIGFRAFDYVTVGLMAIFIIGTGILNFQLKTRTAFFIVTFIEAIFYGFISYFFNHIFIQIVSQSVFSTALGFFSKTMLICTNLHWVMLALIIVGSLTLYGKKEQEVQTLT